MQTNANRAREPLPVFQRLSGGFTLLELLMVVLLVGIISGIAMLSFNPGGMERKIREEADRLAVVMEQAANEAVMQNREYGLQLLGDHYTFLCLNEEKQQWDDCEGKFFQSHTLTPGIQIRILRERQQNLMLSEELSDKDDALLQRKQPDIYFLSNGEASPVSLELDAGDNPELRKVLYIDELGRVTDDSAGPEEEGGDEN